MKEKVALVIKEETFFVFKLLDKFSSWSTARRVLARILVWNGLKQRETLSLTTRDLASAEIILIKAAQTAFSYEIDNLAANGMISKSKLLHLNPFLDPDGILRVGGRLEHANVPYNTRHPIILPKGRLAELLVRHAHEQGAKPTRQIICHNVR